MPVSKVQIAVLLGTAFVASASAARAEPTMLLAGRRLCQDMTCGGRSRELPMLNPIIAATEGIDLVERNYDSCYMPHCGNPGALDVSSDFNYEPRDGQVVRLDTNVEIEVTRVRDDSGRNTVMFTVTDLSGERDTVSITPLLEADNSTSFIVRVGSRVYETQPGFANIEEDLTWVTESMLQMSARLEGVLRRNRDAASVAAARRLLSCGWFGWGGALVGCGLSVAGCISVVTVVGGVLCAGGVATCAGGVWCCSGRGPRSC